MCRLARFYAREHGGSTLCGVSEGFDSLPPFYYKLQFNMITSDPTKANTMCPHCLALDTGDVCLSASRFFEDGTKDYIMQCDECDGFYVEVVDSNENFVDRLKIQVGENEYGDGTWFYMDTGKEIRNC